VKYALFAYLTAEAHDDMPDPDDYGRFLIDRRSQGRRV